MATKLRIFEVSPATEANPRPAPFELEEASILADGDQAKKAAHAMLKDQSFFVRSLNWGPDPNPMKPPILIAYVSKKEY